MARQPVLVYLHGVGGVRPGWAEEILVDQPLDSIRVVAPSYASILSAGEVPATDIPSTHAVLPRQPERLIDDASRAAYRRRQQDLAARVGRCPGVVPAGLAWPAIVPRPTDWPILGLLDSPARFIGGLDHARGYVRDPALRRRVVEHVHRHLEPVLGVESGPIVVIGHSLGALVALDLFAELDQPIDLLVTLGAPLGHPDIAARLVDRGIDCSRLGGWLNVVHLLDPVPIGRGASGLFPAAVDVFLPVLSGARGMRGLIRGIARAATAHLDSTYLASDAVREVIGDALTRPAGGLWATPHRVPAAG